MNLVLKKLNIESIASNFEVYTQGKMLYDENKIENFSVDSQRMMKFIKADILDIGKKYFVYLVFDTNSNFSDYKCSCNSSRIWKGACKHVVATLLATEHYAKTEASYSKSIEISKNILNTFESQNNFSDEIITITSNDTIKVKIIPTVILNSDATLSIKFSLLKTRSYIIKNVECFLNDVLKNNVVSYGKDLVFSHSANNFDDNCLELINFMKTEFEKYSYSLKLYFSQNNSKVAPSTTNSKRLGELLLFPHGIDEFFNLYVGKKITFSYDDNIVNEVFLDDNNPDFKFDLQSVEKKILLTAKKTYTQFIAGGKYDYVLIDNIFHRVSKEYACVLNPIINACLSSRDYSILFEESDAPKFLSIILPKLKSFELIDKKEVFETFEIEDVQVKIYLDTVGKNVHCKVIFSYGDLEINALDKKEYKIVRDFSSERNVKNIINQFGFIEDTQVYILKGDGLIFYLYTQGIKILNNLGMVYATDAFTKKSSKIHSAKSSFGVKLTSELLSISLDTSSYNMHDLIEAIKSYKLNKKYYRLKDGSFIDLSDETMESSANFLLSLDLSKKDIEDNNITLPAYKALYLEHLLTEYDELQVDRNMNFKKLIDDFENYDKIKFELPSIFKKPLRKYQKTGFKWLKTLSHYGFGGILADDMGLGKTVQIVSLLYSERGDNKIPSLVVAPTSLIYNWENEFKKFAPDINVVVVSGTALKRKEILEQATTFEVYITTYDILKRDLDLYKAKNFEYLIADEAQNIKNPSTNNAKAVKSIKSRIRFALTGTPIENYLTELWSIFDFIMPGYLLNLNKFTKTYEQPIVKNNDEHARNKLRKQIEPFILRRLKKDVIKELPDKVETTIYAEMEPEQEKAYVAYLLKARGELEIFSESELNKNKIQVLLHLTRLRQICCHPLLFIEGYKGGSGKLNEAILLIKTSITSGHRILLFSQFTKMLELIKNELNKSNIGYFYLDGATPALKRMDMSDKFNSGENEVFLISVKAGGTGLNLTGADIVIHFDPWWNPAVMNQASDRAHRIGQNKVVQIFNIVAKNSIEEKIVELQNKKKCLIDSVITETTSKEDEVLIQKMNHEDLKELFTRK